MQFPIFWRPSLARVNMMAHGSNMWAFLPSSMAMVEDAALRYVWEELCIHYARQACKLYLYVLFLFLSLFLSLSLSLSLPLSLSLSLFLSFPLSQYIYKLFWRVIYELEKRKRKEKTMWHKEKYVYICLTAVFYLLFCSMHSSMCTPMLPNCFGRAITITLLGQHYTTGESSLFLCLHSTLHAIYSCCYCLLIIIISSSSSSNSVGLNHYHNCDVINFVYPRPWILLLWSVS